jgi:phospho-N-acetylmuramoyl-pentapeptide-transferase
MLYYLHLLKNTDWALARVLNVLRYITVRGAAAAMTAFLVSVILGPWLIRRLRRDKVGEDTGKSDSEELNKLHSSKKGTPTMGGVLMLVAVVISVMLWARPDVLYVPLILGVMGALAILGYADDYIKLRFPGKKGMRARTKLALQLAVGFTVGLVLYGHFSCTNNVMETELMKAESASPACLPGNAVAHAAQDRGANLPYAATATRMTKLAAEEEPGLQINYSSAMESPGTAVYFPFFKDLKFQLGLLFVLFVMIVVAGTSNAVNLTDGLDGLATGTLVMACLAFTAVSYLVGRADYSAYLGIPYVPGAGEVTVVCCAMVGASLGFLWFNCHPAQIFMGDVGALSFGGAIGLVAVVLKQEFLLFLVGGIFVLEALSVCLQVASFRLTGKRIFRIAPLHHHFQFKGWHENKVTVRFWIIAGMLALMSIATLKLR